MNFGETLREAREELGLSEKEVADKLQISAKYIMALERSDFAHIPPRVYARGFLKKYAEHLGFYADDMLSAFDREWAEFHPKSDQKPTKPRAEAWIISALLGQGRAALFFFLAALLAVGVYFLYEFRYVLGEPRLTISSPADDLTTESNVLQVSGRAEEGADVFLNGRPLPVNDLGEFRDSALLLKGLNELEFEAKNRFGKTHRETRYIFVKGERE